MQQKINMIKFREGFRPFAPAILSEETENFLRIIITIVIC